MHKTSLSVGCEDFEGSYEGKDCAWVAQNPNSRCDLCSENGNLCVADYCKQTCNSCDAVKVTASDGADGDLFGRSVAVSDEIIVVGAPGDDDKGSNSGSVYVFELNEERNWYQRQKLTASDGTYFDEFGNSVAVHDKIIVVGAYAEDRLCEEDYYYNYYDDYDCEQYIMGSVHVFTRNEEGNWYEQQKLTAFDGASNSYFGISVAVSDETIVVGAKDDDDGGTNSGSAYVFSLNEEGNWYERKKLTAFDKVEGDKFGCSVAVSDETIVVGAHGDDDGGTNSGSAYVFSLNEEGQHKLTASDRESYDNFGYSVAVSDETIVVGTQNSGSAYVFSLNEEGNWYEQQKLTAFDGPTNSYFGISVAISDETIVVGANTGNIFSSVPGSAYVFSLNEEGNWYSQEKLTPSDAIWAFGRSVAVSDDTIVVGAENGGPTFSGSAYIY